MLAPPPREFGVGVGAGSGHDLDPDPVVRAQARKRTREPAREPGPDVGEPAQVLRTRAAQRITRGMCYLSMQPMLAHMRAFVHKRDGAFGRRGGARRHAARGGFTLGGGLGNLFAGLDGGDGGGGIAEAGVEGGMLPGDVIMRRIIHYLDALPAGCSPPMTRHKLQMEFHKGFLSSILGLVYGESLPSVQERVIRDYNLDDDPRSERLVVAPRRFGKTVGISMFVAALMMAVPNIEIAVFSTGQRASSALMEKVIVFLQGQGSDYTDRLKRKTMEHLYLWGDSTRDDADVRKLHSCPESEKTMRGISANVVIIEEAAAMSEAFFQAVVVPLFTVKNTAVLAISTPQGEENYYSKLLEKRGPDGATLFSVTHINLICDTCRRAGITSNCTHMQHLRPDWLPQDRAAMVASIMSDHKELHAAEAMGQIAKGRNRAFSAAYIERLRSAQAYRDTSTAQPYLFVCVDPTAGGPSRLSATAAYLTSTSPMRLVVSLCLRLHLCAVVPNRPPPAGPACAAQSTWSCTAPGPRPAQTASRHS